MTLNLIDYRPPRIAQLLALVAALLHWSTPLRGVQLYANPPLGIAAGLGGFLIMLWAWWLFRRAETAICPTASSTALVTDGVYRFTRNPMYLGLVGMLLGLAIGVGTLPFYLAAGAFFAVIDQVFIPFEERKMKDTFGGEWLRYRTGTRRWL